MNDPSSVINTPPQQPPSHDGATGRSKIELALDINSCRVIAVAQQLAICAQSKDQFQQFHVLCLSLASTLDDLVDEALNCTDVLREGNCQSGLRGIDYGLAQNSVPAHTSKLPAVLKMVCSRKNELHLQPAIMVLMISVKNACKLNWFPAQDTEELLALADEVVSNFQLRKDFSSEAFNYLPTVSTIISRYYPHFKLGSVLASLEVKPGYGTHLVDFHITKNIAIAKEEKIYLFVAMKDNIDTSSCIITPQEVDVLLNGIAVERRNRAFLDSRPQLPSAVNRYLKYGINLLQVVGQFNGDYIFIIALMSCNPSSSDLPIPQDYEQPVSAAISSDPELIEGPSLVSLNCPISKTRIRTPVKGHLCKHYQCFDLTTFIEMNFKRPSWRCPSCNQSLSFTDLRVDQKILKALQEVGENESEVVFSIDGSFKLASNNKHKGESHAQALDNQLVGHELESHAMLDVPCNMFDLTGEDEEMDIADRSEPVDTKPVVHPNVQAQPVPSNMTLPSLPESIGLTQFSLAQASNAQSFQPGMFNSLPTGFNTRPQAQTGGMSGHLTGSNGMVPVLTDAISPALSRQPDSLQRVDFPMSSPNSPSTNLQMVQDALNSQGMMNNIHFTRNVTRVSSAIQALPVQSPNSSSHMPNITPQLHSRPTVTLPTASGSSAPLQLHPRPNVTLPSASGPSASFQPNSRPTGTLPAASGPSVPFQVPVGRNTQFSSPYGNTVERPQHLSQINANQLQSMALVNRSPSPSVQQGVGHSTPTYNAYLSQTKSQPPHMRSQLPRNHNQHVVGTRTGVSNSTSSNHQAIQPVQLISSQGSLTRPPQTVPLQTQAATRMPSSSVTPQAVTRAENLIDLQSEQSWRPRARMRGALSGPEYDALRSQLESGVSPAQTPSPRPTVPLSRPSIDVLLANRRIASELQDQSAKGTQGEGCQGVK